VAIPVPVSPIPFKAWDRMVANFLLVFNDGNFDEFETFSDRLDAPHAQGVLAKNFNVAASTFRNVPAESCLYSRANLPVLSLKTETSL